MKHNLRNRYICISAMNKDIQIIDLTPDNIAAYGVCGNIVI